MSATLVARATRSVIGLGVAGSISVMTGQAFVATARADGAFVNQAVGYARSNAGTMAFAVPINLSGNPSNPPAARATPPRALPELATPATSGGNFASTLEVGRLNKVFQAQLGSKNISNVGILGGQHNNVGILQAGHHLVSNLVLLNTAGMSVGVIQPNGSAPVNMLIARLPNGGLLIKR